MKEILSYVYFGLFPGISQESFEVGFMTHHSERGWTDENPFFQFGFLAFQALRKANYTPED